MTTSADVVADGVRRAGALRVFVTAAADPAIVDALRVAPLPLVLVPRAGAATAMAAITGQLADSPGVAVVGDDAAEVGASLVEASRRQAPTIVVASEAPTISVPAIKTTIVATADSAAHWVAHAAQAAMKEPPGPVWLVLDPDTARRSALPLATAVRPPMLSPDAAMIDDAAARIVGAARPLLVAGRECRNPATAAWLRALAEALPAPALVTPAARGAMPDPHPLCFGALGADAAILARADLVLALGVDADEVAEAGVTFTAPVLRLGRTLAWVRPTTDVIGNVATLLEELAPRLRGQSRADWDVAELDRLRRTRPAPAVDPRLAAIVADLREMTPAGTAAVFAPSIGPASALWAAVNPGEVFVTDAVVAAALGVALHRPESAVLALTGDISVMATADLSIAAEAHARVIVIAVDVASDAIGDSVGGVRRVVARTAGALAPAIGQALATTASTIIALPAASRRAGAGDASPGRV
jgi:thiamine pyrophosphate-dependent acetolactate synthase large subunit-like protein